MKFCTRCGSRMADRERCHACGAPAYLTPRRVPIAEYPPAGDLPSFSFAYRVALLGLVERQHKVSVPFSYINGTLRGISTFQDGSHPVRTKLWSQTDDPLRGTCDPIVGRKLSPSVRSVVALKLGSGIERSFVLSQIRPHAKAGDRVTLIFPAPIERAINPIYDYAAIAAVNYAASDYTWTTTHPQIHAARLRLPEEQTEVFGDSLASFLDGLGRRCLRLFGQRSERPHQYRAHIRRADITR